MDVNEFLRETLSGCSRRDLAIAADLSEASVSRFLRGKQKIQKKHLIRLSEAAAIISGDDPQIMLYKLANLYNNAYWQHNPAPSFEPEVYSDLELEEFLDEMLRRQNQYLAINYLRCIRDAEELLAWTREVKLRPDFGLSLKLQADFKGKLNAAVLKAGTTFHLYELLRDLFIEIRHALQLVGDVTLRIYLAKWLLAESKKREEQSTMILACSTLAWSYTSSTGGYSNLELADQFSQAAFEAYQSVCNEVNLDPSIIVEIHENRVRIATRQGKLEDAERYIAEGFSFLSNLECLVGGRLYKRFQATFSYHKGMVQYKCKSYEDAEQTFCDVISDSELIGWERGYGAAVSWLMTVAVARQQYEHCLELAAPFTVLSFEECEAYAAQNPVFRAKRIAQHLLAAAETFYALGKNEIADVLKKKADLILENMN